VLQLLAAKVEAWAMNLASPSLQRLALSALYREHKLKRAEGGERLWRLRTDADLALKVFLASDSLSIQSTAAGILGEFGGVDELNSILEADLSARNPEAVENLLRVLAQRCLAPAGTADPSIPLMMALAEKLKDSPHEALAARAVCLRMSEPDLTADARVRLLGLFKTPATRSAAIRVLSSTTPKLALSRGMILSLLADASPLVRTAIFEANLPRLAESANERAKLFLKGLYDSAAEVRLAALKTLKQPDIGNISGLEKILTKLASSDPEADVRAAAQGILRKIQAGAQ
jgi:hypothetical protein